MKYYILSKDGYYLEEEEAPRGWFNDSINLDMFTQRRQAVAEQKRRMKLRIEELERRIKELG